MRTQEWYAPCDPNCPEYSEFVQTLYGDPMSRYAPVGEIVQGYEARHRADCKRCQNYGVENIDIKEIA